MIETDKIVILDYSVFIHSGLAVWQKCPKIPAVYTGMSSIISTLNMVGITPNSTIILAIDSRPSWRCAFESEYKANRESVPQEIRDSFNWLKQKLHEQTNWIIADLGHGIEADDFAVSACKFFKDVPEIILCSSDHDWEQAWSLHPNVKIFSLRSKKWKIKPDNYNVYNEIAKSVHKETSDNLVTTVTSNEEYDKRLMLVDLTRPPEWVDKAIFEFLSKEEIYNKNIPYDTVPVGRDSLQPRLDNIYNNKDKVIEYNQFVAKIKFKEERTKRIKTEKKEKEKRKKEREVKRALKLSKINSKTEKKSHGYGKIHSGCV